MTVPTLLLVFNRPKHTQRVFEAIRKARPERLYISGDAPRPGVPSDPQRCMEVRDVVSTVDWPCRVEYRWNTRNMGCRSSVIAGLDWFFTRETRGIILEDDCLPEPGFFQFCAEQLAMYADNPDVMHISGHLPVEALRFSGDKLWSRMPFIWGWATWSRAWQRYRRDYEGLEGFLAAPQDAFKGDLPSRQAVLYVMDKFVRCRRQEIDTWDYAWLYTILYHKGWCIHPTKALVSNIGFDDEATHTASGRRPPRVRLENTPPFVLSRHNEMALFHASQKHAIGLLMRQLAPALFYDFRIRQSEKAVSL